MRKIVLIALLGLLGLTACHKSTPYVYHGLPKEYTSAWEERYGQCYDSVPYAVVALDLYSEGLELDENHRMRGTGYNLYISDVFVEGDTLAPGTYHSLRPDSLWPKPYTFLPGKEWDGQPTGMYVLYVEDDKLQSIQMLDSGSFVVTDTTATLTDLQFTLYYKNAYSSRVTYTTHFQGPLVPWQKK